MNLSLSDMVTHNSALRNFGKNSDSMEEAANKIVRYLYDHLIDVNGIRYCSLIRFFKTHSYEELEPELRELIQASQEDKALPPATKCLTLLATAGDEPDWNLRKQSKSHRAIPLPSIDMVEKFPMISQLINQLGVDVGTILKPDPAILMDIEEKSYNIFHITEALGSKYIPAQENFVIPYKIKSALGFGGLLPSGDLFTIIIFSKNLISGKTAHLFRTLALSTKISLLPFVAGNIFASFEKRTQKEVQDNKKSVRHDRSQITTMEQLLTVNEKTLVEQTENLEFAIENLKKKHKELKFLFKQVEIAKVDWEISMDCINDMVILTDRNGKIVRVNKAVAQFSGATYKEILHHPWGKFLTNQKLKTTEILSHGIQLFHEPTDKWFLLRYYPIENTNQSDLSGTILTLQDTTEMNKMSEKLVRKNIEMEKNRNKLQVTLYELKKTQAKIIQQEKMASIGQLAAGVAHEINNPIGFISSNLGTLEKYLNSIIEFINFQSQKIGFIGDDKTKEAIAEKRESLDIDYILKDVDSLVKESLDGSGRVRKIVIDLKSFSRVDSGNYEYADINECIESTINIVRNELKYKAHLIKDYGDIPNTKCNAQQLNQVFMNLLVNASQAIQKNGEIKIKTWLQGGFIFIYISDSGCGISPDNMNNIFEPFFTTKEIGKGTGLGLSITYDIVKKHKGEIEVKSEVGKGTEFTIKIPYCE